MKLIAKTRESQVVLWEMTVDASMDVEVMKQVFMVYVGFNHFNDMNKMKFFIWYVKNDMNATDEIIKHFSSLIEVTEVQE